MNNAIPLNTSVSNGTVMVVDDDSSIRRSVSRLLRSAGFTVETFASPSRFLRHQSPAAPACVLLDMCMDGMTGLEVQDALLRNERQVPVLFFSGQGTVATAVAGVRNGAENFLEKPVAPDELLNAVSKAIEHDRAQSAERDTRSELKGRFDRLTPREAEVMTLVVSGLLNKQVAAELGISEKTVKVHRARVMQKLQVESLASLVLIAQRIGVAPAPLSACAASAESGEAYCSQNYW